jgi:hypothetical protein
MNLDNINFSGFSFEPVTMDPQHRVEFGTTVRFDPHELFPPTGDLFHRFHVQLPPINIDSSSYYEYQNNHIGYIDKKDIKKVIDEKLDCCVCFNQVFYGTELICNHKFCFDCIKTIDKSNNNKKCPLCRGTFEILDHFMTKEQEINNNITNMKNRRTKNTKRKEERKREKKDIKELELREKGISKVSLENEMAKRAWKNKRGKR